MITFRDNARLLARATEVSEFLGALANENRMRIVCALINSEKSVNEIAETISTSQSATSQHLKLLREQKVVCSRRSQQTVYYSIPSKNLRSLLSALSLYIVSETRIAGEAHI